MIRQFNERDMDSIIKLWNECVQSGDLLYRKLTKNYFQAKFLDAAVYEANLLFVNDIGEEIDGFIAGCRKHEFLPGQTEQNTPGYLTTLMVSPKARGKGIGSALLEQLEKSFLALGKKNIEVSSLNPIDLDWIIPGTPGHEHNNMPGMDEASSAYQFLMNRGYVPTVHEVAMYLNLSAYVKSDEVEKKRAALRAEGITAGLYNIKEYCEWDGMCDRVGSEYWRKVLKDETSSPSPRPILAARTDGHIVGFTGPVDLQKCGRGWFTGICTDPLYEKKGIATVLFNDLMGEFVKIGAQYSTLFTGTENHARRLYERTGFHPARYFAMMRKELNG